MKKVVYSFVCNRVLEDYMFWNDLYVSPPVKMLASKKIEEIYKGS